MRIVHPRPIRCIVRSLLQNGTVGSDSFRASAVDQKDGSVVLAGTSYGNVTDDLDFFVGKFDAEGTVLWEFQVNTNIGFVRPNLATIGRLVGWEADDTNISSCWTCRGFSSTRTRTQNGVSQPQMWVVTKFM